MNSRVHSAPVIRLFYISAALILLILLLGYAYGKTHKNGVLCRQCNIILITVDTLAQRDVSCDGSSVTTPNLCAFAKNGIRFTKNYAQDTWTLPNIFSLFTSQYSSTHHMLTANSVLNAGIVTLPQYLSGNGYTGIYVGPTDNPHLPLEKGLGKGFTTIIPYRSMEDWKAGIQKLTESSSSKHPVFLYLNTYETHDAWKDSGTYQQFRHFNEEIRIKIVKDYENEGTEISPVSTATTVDHAVFRNIHDAKTYSEAERYFMQLPESSKEYYYANFFLKSASSFTKDQLNEIRQVYDEKVKELDGELSNILSYFKQTGVLKTSVIVITGTHGEAMGEHQGFAHAIDQLYDELINVPLILYYPGIAQRQSDQLMQSIDIFPTILGLTGLKNPGSLSGKNLVPQIQSRPNAETNPFIVSEFGEASQFKTIRNPSWQLHIANEDDASALLFDLTKDPEQLHNVASQRPQIVRFLHTELNNIIRSQPIFK